MVLYKGCIRFMTMSLWLMLTSNLGYAMESVAVVPLVATVPQAKARLNVAQMLLKGEGCTQDYGEAREHLLIVADQNYDRGAKAWANILLAKLYHLGWGVAKDQQMVVKYAEVAERIAKEMNELSEICQLVKVLNDSAFNVHTVDPHGSINLHSAAHYGQIAVAELLLAKGADSNAVYDSGETPLHLASEMGHKNLVEVLIANGADMKAVRPDGKSALHLAAQKGHKDVVELFLANGQFFNCTESFSSSCLPAGLYMEVQMGRTDRVELLLSRIVDLDKIYLFQRIPFLHVASLYGHKDLVKLFLAKGADIRAVDRHGKTPLHWATQNGHKDVVEVLLAHGPDVKAVNNNGSTALHFAAGNGHKDLVEVLLARGADVKAVNNDGSTPLHFAAGNDHKDLVELLLSKGADAGAVDNDGMKAIDLATKSQVKAVLKKSRKGKK